MTDPDIWSLHDAACERGEASYVDPQTGFVVFTKIGLLQRGKCCGAGCRHCPFEHENVPTKRRAGRIQQPAWLTDARPSQNEDSAFLFWSGGKDSFLAYRALVKEGRLSPILVTTFDARTRMIAHQEFSIDEVVLQAQALGVSLIGVPLHPEVEYVEGLAPAFDLVPQCAHLAFGDLHLDHIRGWREDAFAAHERTASMTLEFPLWEADYNGLLDDLFRSGAQCFVSAMPQPIPGIEIGDVFNELLIKRLPPEIDAFGENGEFHTRIIVASQR